MYLYILGSIVYVYISKEYKIVSQKFVFCMEKGILVSFEGNHIYKVFIPSCVLNKIVWLLNVWFNELDLITDSDDNDNNLNRLQIKEDSIIEVINDLISMDSFKYI